MELLFETLFVLLGLAVLDLAALKWGKDSVEDFNDPEWARRRAWRGFGGH